MRVLILADPIETLNFGSDTGWDLAREALEREHSVMWATDQDVRLNDGRLEFRVRELKLDPTGGGVSSSNALPTWLSADRLEAVLIRKDPPFDHKYQSLCWILSAFEENLVFLNRPSLLLRYHEKMLPLNAFQMGHLTRSEWMPFSITSGEDPQLPALKARQKQVVLTKPWLGFGGRGVEVHPPGQLSAASEPYLIYQKFESRIGKLGDRRVFCLNGKVMGDFVRLPGEGSIRANLAQGGSAVLRPLTAKQKKTLQRMARYLKKTGIEFAGVDLIGDRVSEVNITAPTGVVMLREMTQVNLAQAVLQRLETLVLARRKNKKQASR